MVYPCGAFLETLLQRRSGLVDTFLYRMPARRTQTDAPGRMIWTGNQGGIHHSFQNVSTLNRLQPCFPVQHAHEIHSKAIRIPTRLSTFAAFLGEAQLPSALRSLLEIRRARLRPLCRSRCLHWSAPDASVAASRQSWTPIRELRALLVVFDGIEAIPTALLGGLVNLDVFNHQSRSIKSLNISIALGVFK